MAVLKQLVGTRTALTATGIGTLASATYCVSNNYNCTTNQPVDVIVELEAATTNSPAGNKQVVVFIQESLDGTNFRSGPTSGTTTTDEPDLRFLGTVPINTGTTTHRGTFSIMQSLGYVPAYFKVVVKNDLGAAITSAALYTAEISNTVT